MSLVSMELCAGVHTAQRQITTQIPIEFCILVIGLGHCQSDYTISIGAFLPTASEGWGKVRFSVCSHLGGGGGGGGYPGQVQTGGDPSQVQFRYPPCQTSSGGGYPARGTPPRVPSQLGGTPAVGGTPPQVLPPIRPSRGGTPAGVGGGGCYPTTGNRWSTWYAAVGMPLAFTQEDFLVLLAFVC